MFEGPVASGKWRAVEPGFRPAPAGLKPGATIVAAIVFATTVAFAASKPTLRSIGEALICECGCGQTVYGCNHFECASRAEMNALIEKEIAAGKDETTILQDFVKKYGVQVLASPPAKGFTLLAWVLPGLGLVVGLAVVITFVRRWRKPPAKPDQSPPAPIDPKLLEAVEEEMKRIAG
jgi:cytochrome c-type biogenesis protein CcmH